MEINMEIVLLGSTGSIGEQTLDVARMHNIKVLALAAKSNIKKLEEQAREFKPTAVCVYDESKYLDLKQRLSDTNVNVLGGMEGLKQISSMKACVVNAVVGMVGLEPTLAAVEAGNNVALANKETIVTGGEIVMASAQRKGVKIIPIDSEHSAIFQCLTGNTKNRISKIMLTASGGPFFGFTKEQLRTVTREQALNHPNWNMGAKITTDSATLMNKGLEFIEAVWLFDVCPETIEVVIHRQSVVHSAVEFIDGSIIAQMGAPDMRVPIQFALTFPKRLNSLAKHISLLEIRNLTFEEPDEEVFSCLKMAKEAVKKGGNACTILNSANEEAVSAFLNNKIRFFEIEELVSKAVQDVKFDDVVSLKSIFETQKEVQDYIKTKLNK